MGTRLHVCGIVLCRPQQYRRETVEGMDLLCNIQSSQNRTQVYDQRIDCTLPWSCLPHASHVQPFNILLSFNLGLPSSMLYSDTYNIKRRIPSSPCQPGFLKTSCGPPHISTLALRVQHPEHVHFKATMPINASWTRSTICFEGIEAGDIIYLLERILDLVNNMF